MIPHPFAAHPNMIALPLRLSAALCDLGVENGFATQRSQRAAEGHRENRLSFYLTDSLVCREISPRVTAFSNRQSKDTDEPFTIRLDGHRRIFPFQPRYRPLLRSQSITQHQRILPLRTQRAVVAG